MYRQMLPPMAPLRPDLEAIGIPVYVGRDFLTDLVKTYTDAG